MVATGCYGLKRGAGADRGQTNREGGGDFEKLSHPVTLCNEGLTRRPGSLSLRA